MRAQIRPKSDCYTFTLHHEHVKCHNFRVIFVLGGQLHALQIHTLEIEISRPRFRTPSQIEEVLLPLSLSSVSVVN